MMFRFILPLLLSAMIAAPVMAMPNDQLVPWGSPGQGQQMGHKCGAMKQLNLSEAQKQQLKALREQKRANHQPGDWKKMSKEERQAKRAAIRQDLQAILTPAQFQQFEELKGKCMQERRQHRKMQRSQNS